MGEGSLHNQRVVRTIAYTLRFDTSSHSQNRTSSLVSLDRDSRDRKEPTLHPYIAHFRHSASPDRTREELCRDLRTQVLGRILRLSSSCYWRSFLAVSIWSRRFQITRSSVDRSSTCEPLQRHVLDQGSNLCFGYLGCGCIGRALVSLEVLEGLARPPTNSWIKPAFFSVKSRSHRLRICHSGQQLAVGLLDHALACWWSFALPGHIHA
jgi:hypothetical protein